MPSSHSTAIMYMACYSMLWVADELDPPLSNSPSWSILSLLYDHAQSTLLINGAILATCLFVAGSRVLLGHHTMEQVLVGLLIGVGFGWFWRRLLRASFLALAAPFLTHVSATRLGVFSACCFLLLFVFVVCFAREKRLV
ncbi:hypothetical protein BDR26DRAFT_864871 [Obelidium mucronatum]|nr:hypothetical protein BDR26DRAFT_864871 [Obelidium mucronatum]